MTTFEIVRDLFLLALASLGAGLSVYNFIDIRRRVARSLDVKFTTVIPAYPEGELGEPLFQVTVTNVGQRNVTVTNLGIELPERRTLALLHHGYPWFEDTRVPTTLEDGAIAHRCFSYADVATAIRSNGLPRKIDLKPFAVDSAGARHYGDPISFDADQY